MKNTRILDKFTSEYRLLIEEMLTADKKLAERYEEKITVKCLEEKSLFLTTTKGQEVLMLTEKYSKRSDSGQLIQIECQGKLKAILVMKETVPKEELNEYRLNLLSRDILIVHGE